MFPYSYLYNVFYSSNTGDKGEPGDAGGLKGEKGEPGSVGSVKGEKGDAGILAQLLIMYKLF